MVRKIKCVRPSVFVGSSAEGIRIAKNIQLELDRDCEVQVWSQGVFGLSQGGLESLVRSLDHFDFAVLVLTPDDLVTSRNKTENGPRDNVLFELGLFMGGLGRDRTFIVHERTKKMKLPSDLAGAEFATFEPHKNGNLQAALGAPCTRILSSIEKIGLRDRKKKHKRTSRLSVRSWKDNKRVSPASIVAILKTARGMIVSKKDATRILSGLSPRITNEMFYSMLLNPRLDETISRVYWELLGRVSDPVGRSNYGCWLAYDGWTEERMRQHIMSGDEYKKRSEKRDSMVK